MARRPRGSTEVGAPLENAMPPENNSTETDSIDEESDREDENRLNAEVDNDGALSSELALLEVDIGVGALVGPTPAMGNIYITNAREGLNLRSGPGVDFPIIRSLAFGTLVHLVKREGRWGLVDVKGDGATDGFVYLSFLDQRVSVDTQTMVLPADRSSGMHQKPLLPSRNVLILPSAPTA